MFKENNILCFEILIGYDRDDLLSLKRMKDSAPIPLNKLKFEMILDIIHYHNFMYQKGGKAIVYDSTQWGTKDSEAWRGKVLNERNITIASNTAYLDSTTTTTTTTTVIHREIVLNKEVILKIFHNKIVSVAVLTTTPPLNLTKVILTNKNSSLTIYNFKKEGKDSEYVSLNLTSFVAVAVAIAIAIADVAADLYDNDLAITNPEAVSKEVVGIQLAALLVTL